MNSDDCFWPEFQTGRKVLKRIEVPLLAPVDVSCSDCKGTGREMVWLESDDELPEICGTCGGKGTVTKTSDVTETALPEYVRGRQLRAPDTWYMTKLMTPEALIWGWIGKHADPPENIPHERLAELWQERFPGAEFPHKGWRIPTDACLPRAAGGCRTPNWQDTRHFVACIHEQTRLGFDERLRDMLASDDAKTAAVDRTIGDGIRDLFPALLNPTPGKKSSFVSFPWTKRDKQM